MRFLEKNLEEIIFNSDPKELDKLGLKMPRYKRRQVRLGDHGIADIVGLDYKNYHYEDHPDRVTMPIFSVYELKQNKISVSSLMQAIGYAHALKKFCQRRGDIYFFSKIRIVLIGNEIDNFSSLKYLPKLVHSDSFAIEFFTYDYTLSGIKFTSHHSLIDL